MLYIEAVFTLLTCFYMFVSENALPLMAEGPGIHGSLSNEPSSKSAARLTRKALDLMRHRAQ